MRKLERMLESARLERTLDEHHAKWTAQGRQVPREQLRQETRRVLLGFSLIGRTRYEAAVARRDGVSIAALKAKAARWVEGTD